MKPVMGERLFDVSASTVVVTGGAGVLGGAIACALVEWGAKVAILDLDPAAAVRLRDRLDRGPGRAIVVGADVLDRDSLAAASSRVSAELGPVDTLVNAAGGNVAAATTGPDLSFFDLPAEGLRRVTDLNLLGTILPCQVFGREMAAAGAGVILNVSSMNALRPLTRIPGYSAAKAAVSNFTQWLAVHMAQEYSPDIRVNAIAPGFFATEQNRFLLMDSQTGELTQRGETIVTHTPMRRFGEPDDLLGTVRWLLSDASAFVTGIVVPVDGGFSAFSGV
jgi:NAD(P)-dependent dehydrogenase (short-subunit alcohol dehydrogenase family)